MISYIQKSILDVIGINDKIISIKDKNYHSDDECRVCVSSDDDDEKDEDEYLSDEINERLKGSISPRGPTTDALNFSVHDNESITKNYRQSNSTISNLSKKPGVIVRVKTRSSERQANEELISDQDIKNLENKDSSSAADKIGFSGIKKIISKQQ